MTNFIWLKEEIILAIHDEQLTAHGGITGCRDIGLLQSPLAKPQQLHHYGTPDIADLAASYAYGIARNHAFFDGNKRTAFVALELFLAVNGFEFLASDAECVIKTLELAAGELSEAQLASWIRTHMHTKSTHTS